MLEANFASHQRNEAIEEAKQLERQQHIQAVKVVREQRSGKTGLTRETTVYNGCREKEERRREHRGDDDDDDGPSFDDDGPSFDDDGPSSDDGPAGDDDGIGGRDWGDMEIDVSPKDWGDMDVGGARDDDIPKLVQRPAGTQAAAKNTAGGPEAAVISKLLVIGVISVAFAAIATYIIRGL
ncbi:MAG: hypothetical protein FJX65_13095 [Alphaproteobacteria bacterium]|nr:hypothetical protein [Alphaproteobacteria bacterium]